MFFYFFLHLLVKDSSNKNKDSMDLMMDQDYKDALYLKSLNEDEYLDH